MASRRALVQPHRRKGFWYLIKRVPREFEAHDKRGLVMLSTGIRIVDDPYARSARRTVQELDETLRRYWVDLKAGVDPDVRGRYERALEAAVQVGVPYLPAQQVSALPLVDLVKRVEVLDHPAGIEDERVVAGVLGGVAPPGLKLSEMGAEYERIVAASLKDKSERQLQKWRVPLLTAINTFIEVVGGDRGMGDLTRRDALALRAYWQQRIVKGEVEIDTANRSIGHVKVIYAAINESQQLELPPLFDKLRFRGAQEKQRVAFAAEFVQNRILCEGALGDLNAEARRVVYVVAETGLRLSEACNLTESTIRLDDRVPHVQVRPEGREMKTAQSRRDIPLVGVALMAMREQPGGFPRYRDKADSLSALVNKVMEAHGLRLEEGQSLYSLRHTFEDRLTAVEAPEKVVAALMGHKWHRPRYGLGPSLEQKRSWLERIAFRPPATV